MKQTITYIIKVKFPIYEVDSYEDNYLEKWERKRNQAIFDVKPEEFEVCWTELSSWPIDKEGFTWVTLYCIDQRKAIEYFLGRIDVYRNKLEAIKQMI